MISYFPSVFTNNPDFIAIIYVFTAIGFISGAIFIAFLIFTLSSTYKGRFQRPITYICIFFVGAQSITSIIPGSWSIFPAVVGWNMAWSFHLGLSFSGLFLVCGLLILIYSWHHLKARKRSKSALYRNTSIIIVISLNLFLFAALILLVSRILPFLPRFTFLIPMTLCIWGIFIALWLNPTVLVITAPPIRYLFIVDAKRNVPLFFYDFEKKRSSFDFDLVSMILGSVRAILGEVSVSLKGISTVTTNYGQLLVEESLSFVAFLVADGEVTVTRDSLRFCTKDFTRRYKELVLEGDPPDVGVFTDFSEIVEKYFDFAF